MEGEWNHGSGCVYICACALICVCMIETEVTRHDIGTLWQTKNRAALCLPPPGTDTNLLNKHTLTNISVGRNVEDATDTCLISLFQLLLSVCLPILSLLSVCLSLYSVGGVLWGDDDGAGGIRDANGLPAEQLQGAAAAVHGSGVCLVHRSGRRAHTQYVIKHADKKFISEFKSYEFISFQL